MTNYSHQISPFESLGVFLLQTGRVTDILALPKFNRRQP